MSFLKNNVKHPKRAWRKADVKKINFFVEISVGRTHFILWFISFFLEV